MVGDHMVRYLPKDEERVQLLSISQFEAETALRYLPQLEFEDQKTKERVAHRCRLALLNREVSHSAKWLGASYRNEFQNSKVNEVTIKYIDEEMGFGLFANKKIEKWEWIAEYTGVIRSINIFYSFLNSYCFRYPLYGLHFWYFAIDAIDGGNEVSFMNHSSSPNCSSFVFESDELFHIGIRAMRVIYPGEELTFDYGTYWSRILN